MTPRGLIFDVEFAEECDAQEYDWPEVEKRITKAASHAGIPLVMVAKMLGLEIEASDYWWRRISLDPIPTVCQLATYLNVSSGWLLTGKGNGPEDGPGNTAEIRAISDVHDSVVVQGNSGTVVIQSGGPINEHQKELLRVYNQLPIKSQVALLKFAHDLEAQNSNSA